MDVVELRIIVKLYSRSRLEKVKWRYYIIDSFVLMVVLEIVIVVVKV